MNVNGHERGQRPCEEWLALAEIHREPARTGVVKTARPTVAPRERRDTPCAGAPLDDPVPATALSFRVALE